MTKFKVNLDNQYMDNVLDPIDLRGMSQMDLSSKIKNLMSEALKKCPYSRYEVAAKMSEITRKEVNITP